VPGIYTVKQGGVEVGAAVVNIDPRESDTRPIPIESLKGGVGATVSVARDEEDLVVGAKSRPLWPQLAGCVLTPALLLAASSGLNTGLRAEKEYPSTSLILFDLVAISQRELQVVRLVFEDERERIIAARLEISLHTVHAHMKHLRWKLGVSSRAGLVLRVFRECLADLAQFRAGAGGQDFRDPLAGGDQGPGEQG